MRRSTFVRDGWAFRFSTMNGRPHWGIFPKGDRCHWSQVGTISEASDGATYIISPCMGVADARPTFEQAVALALDHAQAWQARRGY
jgi:hypothetical protein